MAEIGVIPAQLKKDKIGPKRTQKDHREPRRSKEVQEVPKGP